MTSHLEWIVTLGGGCTLRRFMAFALIAISLAMPATPARGTPAQKGTIVFVSNRDGGPTWQLYAMNFDGSHQKRLLPYHPYPRIWYPSADLVPTVGTSFLLRTHLNETQRSIAGSILWTAMGHISIV
jgi:hypothetical protein